MPSDLKTSMYFFYSPSISVSFLKKVTRMKYVAFIVITFEPSENIVGVLMARNYEKMAIRAGGSG